MLILRSADTSTAYASRSFVWTDTGQVFLHRNALLQDVHYCFIPYVNNLISQTKKKAHIKSQHQFYSPINTHILPRHLHYPIHTSLLPSLRQSLFPSHPPPTHLPHPNPTCPPSHAANSSRTHTTRSLLRHSIRNPLIIRSRQIIHSTPTIQSILLP